MKKVKRLCLFAGYDSKGVILKYVIHYVKAMSELADVYYMADCEMDASELDKLAPYTKERYAFRHKKYDFGSWQELINKIGWDKVAEYDELILCNDSCFGPLNNSLPYIFEKASNDNECDFWGASAPLDNQYFHSYFLVFKKNLFTSEIFKNFIASIKEEANKEAICKLYEEGLFHLLKNNNFKPKQIIDLLADPSHRWKSLIQLGFPFFKITVLYSITPENTSHSKLNFANIKRGLKVKSESLINFENFIKHETKYNWENIEEYLNHHNFDKSLFKKPPFKYRLGQIKLYLKFLRKNIFWKVSKHKDRKLLKICGITIYNKGAMKAFLSYEELKALK